MSAILTIARLTLQEARRKRTVVAALGLGLAFLALFAIGFWFIVSDMRLDRIPAEQVRFGYSFLLLAGFYVVHFLTVMLTIFSSAGTLAGEISSHTIQTLVTKPVRRSEVLIGKWLGHGAMLSLYVALLAGGLVVTVRVLSEVGAPGAFGATLLLVLEALVLLAVSLLGGTRLSTTANGVLLFLVYGLAFIGAWVGQIGALLQAEGAMRVGTWTRLLLPVEALWRRAASLLTPPIPLPVTPFTGGSTPGEGMVLYAIAYTAVALGLAMVAFQKRDL